MAVGRPGIDGTDHLVRGGVDDRDDGAILAGDVDHAVGRESERMRRNVRCEVDIADMGASLQVDYAKKMTRIGIAAMDSVAEDRHIGEPRLRQDQKLVHRAGKAVEYNLGCKTDGVKKQNFCADLVDRDHSVRGIGAAAHVIAFAADASYQKRQEVPGLSARYAASVPLRLRATRQLSAQRKEDWSNGDPGGLTLSPDPCPRATIEPRTSLQHNGFRAFAGIQTPMTRADRWSSRRKPNAAAHYRHDRLHRRHLRRADARGAQGQRD